ncbi:MAG: carbonate dehydratase [Oceanospirillaceae bacterium]|jgi:carbonic anhydrase|uniref:carbonate dehydratase n=1 Tax=Marinobacterium litorale TaxID=404770 RepID=UPI0004046FE0|nr:carbonate dehydratase [Marinobacterium litorale]MBS98780.1 carbonate dehydratase [Oceanospirillaceae bacterium]
MNNLESLFEKNRSWSERISEQDPEFFPTLASQQAPEYLWIGCSDSRVPANEIVDLLPGELFVHRNVSNLVVHSDMNCLSVLQFAVEVLKVKHVMVVGHYGCGGVRAAMDSKRHGLIDNWLSHIRDVYLQYRHLIGPWQDTVEQNDLLCELNVIEQAHNVCNTTIVQDAWERGQDLTVHSWVYTLTNGQLTDLQFCASAQDRIDAELERAVSRVEQLVRSKA